MPWPRVAQMGSQASPRLNEKSGARQALGSDQGRELDELVQCHVKCRWAREENMVLGMVGYWRASVNEQETGLRGCWVLRAFLIRGGGPQSGG